MEDAQKLLEDIIRAIVNSPDKLKIERRVDEMGVLFRVWVDQKDMGLIIGKGGTTANAIKLIIKMAGYKNKSHIAIKFEEPIGK